MKKRDLEYMHATGYISRDEATDAQQAENNGVESHTIGYETEVLYSAVDDIRGIKSLVPDPKLSDSEVYHQKRNHLFECIGDVVGPCGYNVAWDGAIEYCSPSANHSYPLEVATRGLVRAGMLPDGTSGRITSHISIGTDGDIEEKLPETIDTLRNLEMLGGSTGARLYAPVSIAKKSGADSLNSISWAQKGTLGVKIDANPTAKVYSLWSGSNDRIEMRSLIYDNPDQFAGLLRATYYLTRGLFAEPGTTTHDIYTEHRDWMNNYCDDHRLPAVNQKIFKNNDAILYMTLPRFSGYIAPYARHLRDADLSAVRQQSKKTVQNLTEEFGDKQHDFDFVGPRNSSVAIDH